MRVEVTRRGNYIFCPACKQKHLVPLNWQFNGDVLRPTFRPSLNLKAEGYCCHSVIENGQIKFLGDCTHIYAGTTLPLPDLTKIRNT